MGHIIEDEANTQIAKFLFQFGLQQFSLELIEGNRKVRLNRDWRYLIDHFICSENQCILTNLTVPTCI